MGGLENTKRETGEVFLIHELKFEHGPEPAVSYEN